MSQHQSYSSVNVVGDDDVVRGGVCEFVESDHAVVESQYWYLPYPGAVQLVKAIAAGAPSGHWRPG